MADGKGGKNGVLCLVFGVNCLGFGVLCFGL
jgi:hypothetical protein